MITNDPVVEVNTSWEDLVRGSRAPVFRDSSSTDVDNTVYEDISKQKRGVASGNVLKEDGYAGIDISSQPQLVTQRPLRSLQTLATTPLFSEAELTEDYLRPFDYYQNITIEEVQKNYREQYTVPSMGAALRDMQRKAQDSHLRSVEQDS
ncbi:hypothetical protein BLNAU_19231 [Blattamonas nauphoetae]|uniref:Uncharacterized protein n=1 Tax=Blattamonas nauphoetae TaxID=2049346 RepID=A0ABQ9X269_9EUKA|nr:hypothetical protein BLNAU_19231 [Blattamonas nauphoetae]